MRLAHWMLLLGGMTIGCSDPLEPVITDVGAARVAWVALAPAAYSFELSISSSWFPPAGFTLMHVEDGVVVSAIDSSGDSVAGFPHTIETIWGTILDAQSAQELNEARFRRDGVPLEVNIGDWALDGGVHYSIRNFRQLR